MKTARKPKIGTAPASWGSLVSRGSQSKRGGSDSWTRRLKRDTRGSNLVHTGTARGGTGKRQLRVSGTFAMCNLEESSAWPDLLRQVLEAGESLATQGAKFIELIDDTYSDLFTGRPTGPSKLNDAAWGRLVDTTHQVADIGRERFDLTLVYHPHAETHVEYEDQFEKLLGDRSCSCVALS